MVANGLTKNKDGFKLEYRGTVHEVLWCWNVVSCLFFLVLNLHLLNLGRVGVFNSIKTCEDHIFVKKNNHRQTSSQRWPRTKHDTSLTQLVQGPCQRLHIGIWIAPKLLMRRSIVDSDSLGDICNNHHPANWQWLPWAYDPLATPKRNCNLFWPVALRAHTTYNIQCPMECLQDMVPHRAGRCVARTWDILEIKDVERSTDRSQDVQGMHRTSCWHVGSCCTMTQANRWGDNKQQDGRTTDG